MFYISLLCVLNFKKYDKAVSFIKVSSVVFRMVESEFCVFPPFLAFSRAATCHLSQGGSLFALAPPLAEEDRLRLQGRQGSFLVQPQSYPGPVFGGSRVSLLSSPAHSYLCCQSLPCIWVGSCLAMCLGAGQDPGSERFSLPSPQVVVLTGRGNGRKLLLPL